MFVGIAVGENLAGPVTDRGSGAFGQLVLGFLLGCLVLLLGRRLGSTAAGLGAALAWVVAPWLADRLTGPAPMARSLITLLAVGLVWQFVMVMWLVRREQGTLRWSVVREALWLKPPTSPKTGRVGGRVWLTTLPSK